MIRYLQIFVIVFLLFGCTKKQADRFNDTPTTGIIKFGADQCFEPLIEQEVQVFEGIYKQASLLPIYDNEVDLINLLLKDSIRLAITTRKLTKNEMNYLKSKKFYPQEIKIASDAIAFIINKRNSDSIISVKDLRRILTGEIKTWNQLKPGSNLGKIELVFDNPNSSTVRYAIDSICNGKPLSKELRAQKTNSEVINYVSKTPNSIGVIGANWIGNKADTTGLSFNESITVMAVSSEDIADAGNSYKPYQAYIALRNYPLCRDIYAILNDPRRGLASGFIAFVNSYRGQKIILKTGIVPATQPVRIVDVNENL